MSESFENVIRRIETKFAMLADEVDQLRADREILARELLRIRNDRNRAMTDRSRTDPSDPAATSERNVDPSSAAASASQQRSKVDNTDVEPAPKPNADPVSNGVPTTNSTVTATDASLSDADWERLSGNR